MGKEVEIVPSILSADFAVLAEEIKKVAQAGCKRLHLDVMDGHFVPNITIGPVVIVAIRRRTTLYLEAHLMIEQPERYLKDFKAAGLDSVIIHQEACCHFSQTVREIKSLGMSVGLALSPKIPVESVKDIIREIDLILIMTVEPGFGGQSFLKGIEKKIIETRALLEGKKVDIPIEVDGGINSETAPLVINAGATRLVAGQAVFGGGRIEENIEKLRKAIL